MQSAQRSRSSAPQRIGKYLLYEPIGAGSMGRVYRARAYGPGGVVKELCLKRIRADRVSSAGALERFVDEAAVAMRLAHANIVPVFDFGRAADEYYMAMEWVDGADLLRIIEELRARGQSLASEIAAHVAAEVARALAYAHELETDPIVHRDIKPANVLVSRAGDVRLTDFGVAAALGDRSRGIGGTPAYMAPEQRAGAVIDPRSDLYSLGVTLYESLTGDLPSSGERWAGTWDDVPTELAAIVRSLLAKRPGDRPASARDVAAQLEAFVARARAAGAKAPRDQLAELASAAARTHARATVSVEGDRSGGRERALPDVDELAPELSFVEDGDRPGFVTEMTLPGIGPAKERRRDDPGTSDEMLLETTFGLSETAIPAGGQRFGRYQLCFEIASGGMASVFLARSEGPGGFEKLVALKRIHPHLATQRAFVEMFLDEARVASRISHRNVCSVFDFGRVDGTYYIAMEYIVGETLATVMDRLRETKPVLRSNEWPTLAARIVADACEGLHAAHELRGDRGEPLGLVHRDISPQNLFVGYDGNVSIADFGVAHAEGRLHQTKTGEVKGKLSYMSPEQSKKKELDRRADVWSMGVVLWELIVGQSLFRRDTDADTILALFDDRIDPPSKFRSDIPAELDRIVMRALERDRDARYATARELGRDLNRFIASCETPVTTAELAEWMERVFADDLERKRALVEEARRAATAPVPRPELPDASPRVQYISVPPLSSTDSISGPTSLFTGGRPSGGVGVGVALAIGAAIVGVAVAFGIPGGDTASSGEDEPVAAVADVAAPRVERAPGGDQREGPGRRDGTDVRARGASDVEPPEQAEEEPGPSGQEEGTEAVEPDEIDGETRSGGGDRPQRRATRPGRLSIATPGGWADVYVDNRRAGRAPGELVLSPGRHLVSVRPFGRGPERRRRIRIPSGGTLRIVVPVAE